jgi:hypothetical protein
MKGNVPNERLKSRKEMVRSLDHQVHIQRYLRHLVDRLRYGRSHGKIIHKMSIHDIDVKPVGSSFFDPSDFLAYSREIARKH